MLEKESIPILYEDADLLVINKPAGLIVHPDGKTAEDSVTAWIENYFPEIKGVGEVAKLANGDTIERPGIVHRIDRETSGALVIAKNQSAFLFLKQGFQERVIEKTYSAFVYGEMKNDFGTIDRPIARSKNDFRLWSAQRGTRGQAREAVTDYTVRARGEGFSLLEVHPRTGRTHQIRVHLKAINYPIVCDKLYAPKYEPALGFSRLALHARKISLTLPSGKSLEVEAPYPDDFVRARAVLGLKNEVVK